MNQASSRSSWRLGVRGEGGGVGIGRGRRFFPKGLGVLVVVYGRGGG